jgi:hypothetical protein
MAPQRLDTHLRKPRSQPGRFSTSGHRISVMFKNGYQIPNTSDVLLCAVFEPGDGPELLPIERRFRCRESCWLLQILVKPLPNQVVLLFFVPIQPPWLPAGNTPSSFPESSWMSATTNPDTCRSSPARESSKRVVCCNQRYARPTPRVITPATCRSGVKTTKSASAPMARMPFLPASPRRRAGRIVAMRTASTKGTPSSTM